MASIDTITVEPQEVEALADIIELWLSGDLEGYRTTEERRGRLNYLRELVDAAEALEAAGGKAVTLPAAPAVLDLIGEGCKALPEDFAAALEGRSGDPEGEIRKAKGMMSLGHRLGMYDGVMV